MKENVILGIVHRLEYPQLAPFIESYRAFGGKSKLHLFVLGVSPESLKKLEGPGISLEPYFYISIRMRQPLLVFWSIWKRMFASRDMAGKCAMGKKVFHLFSLRFVLYYEYLLKHRGQYENVLMTDLRDAYVQRDPFSDNLGPGVHCFLEASTQLIGKCRANTRMVQASFGREAVAELAACPVSCAGTVMGDVESALKYLERMIEAFCSLRKMVAGSDQGVHNYLLHHGRIPNLVLHDNYSSSVFTAGCEKPETILFNDRNQIIRKDGAVYPVLHQYDRHPDIMARVHTQLGAGH